MSSEMERAAKKLLAYRTASAVLEQDFLLALEAACRAGTGKEVAAGIGISPQYLSDIRRGRRAITYEVLKGIVNAS